MEQQHFESTRTHQTHDIPLVALARAGISEGIIQQIRCDLVGDSHVPPEHLKLLNRKVRHEWQDPFGKIAP